MHHMFAFLSFQWCFSCDLTSSCLSEVCCFYYFLLMEWSYTKVNKTRCAFITRFMNVDQNWRCFYHSPHKNYRKRQDIYKEWVLCKTLWLWSFKGGLRTLQPLWNTVLFGPRLINFYTLVEFSCLEIRK